MAAEVFPHLPVQVKVMKKEVSTVTSGSALDTCVAENNRL